MLGLWWASGIETEIKQMLHQLDNKVFFRSYRDKYFFSNSEKKAHERMLQEVEREVLIEGYKKKIRIGKGARQADVSEDRKYSTKAYDSMGF